jgi:signal transduction histidine kinase
MEHEFILEGISLEKKFDPGLPQVQGDNNQLQQVFVNLISNARDAIVSCKDGRQGCLKIETFRSQDGKELCARFSDNGCGMSPELIRKIFDPFFTTKGPDRGMGLGLAICYRIVENHRGRIQVESKEGCGSVFTVCLPCP